MTWEPIETAPKGAKGYAWMQLAWGEGEEWTTAAGLRHGDKFFAACTFYCLGQDRKFQFREVEVNPTHWMENPERPDTKGA